MMTGGCVTVNLVPNLSRYFIGNVNIIKPVTFKDKSRVMNLIF